jgi:hypothetical protein
MSELQGKVSRALIKQKVQLKLADRKQEQENETNTGISQEDAEQARKFLKRTKARGQDNQEASLTIANKRMELNQNQENVDVHEIIFHSMLDYLEKIHHDFIREESLSNNMESEKSSVEI